MVTIRNWLQLLIPSIAFAVTRTVGQTIVYDFNEAIHSTPTHTSRMSPKIREKMIAAQNKPQRFVLTMNLDEISPKARRMRRQVSSIRAGNVASCLRDAQQFYCDARRRMEKLPLSTIRICNQRHRR